MFPSECVGFINGEPVICGSEMWLRSLMWITGSLGSFMMRQLYLPCLTVGGIQGSAWDHWLLASCRALMSHVQVTFRSRTCIREISSIRGQTFSNHVHTHVRYHFAFLFPCLKVNNTRFKILQTSSLTEYYFRPISVCMPFLVLGEFILTVWVSRTPLMI